MELTRCWGDITPGRTLFIALGYHGGDRDNRRGLFARFESPAARGHRIVHRNHYANPRPLTYVMAMIARAAADLATTAPDLVFDPRLGELSPEVAARFARAVTVDPLQIDAWRGELLSETAQYDQIVLVYSDALGLGCEAVEAHALLRHARVLIVNGRRRAFRLDGTMQTRLSISRFLAHTRLVERVMAAALRPIGTVLAWSGR